MAEQLIRNQQVGGSTPLAGSTIACRSVCNGVLLPLLLAEACVLAGCEVTSVLVNQSIEAGTTAAEDRSLYSIADDFAIKSEITHQLLDENLLLFVNTDVYLGQVMLTGAVERPEDRHKAEGIARRVKGVRELYNEIQVTRDGGFKAAITDVVIETKLKANLLIAKGISSINYRWRSVNGVLYLLGAALSRDELERVVTLARETVGVRRVVSHVRVKPLKPS